MEGDGAGEKRRRKEKRERVEREEWTGGCVTPIVKTGGDYALRIMGSEGLVDLHNTGSSTTRWHQHWSPVVQVIYTYHIHLGYIGRWCLSMKDRQPL